MSAGDLFSVFLLLIVVGFVIAFIYLVFLQRRAVVTQAKASNHVTTMTSQQETSLANAQRVLGLQEQSLQGQQLSLQIAKEQLALQQEHNALLRDLLTRLVERAGPETPK